MCGGRHPGGWVARRCAAAGAAAFFRPHRRFARNLFYWPLREVGDSRPPLEHPVARLPLTKPPRAARRCRKVLEQQPHLSECRGTPKSLQHAVCGEGDGEGGPVRCPPAPPRLCTPPSPRTALQRVRRSAPERRRERTALRACRVVRLWKPRRLRSAPHHSASASRPSPPACAHVSGPRSPAPSSRSGSLRRAATSPGERRARCSPRSRSRRTTTRSTRSSCRTCGSASTRAAGTGGSSTRRSPLNPTRTTDPDPDSWP